MSKLTPLNDYVLLQKYDKVKKGDSNSPFTMALAVSNTNLGVVLYSSTKGIKVGSKVYFVGSVDKLMLEDATEVLAVKSGNIVASIEGTSDE